MPFVFNVYHDTECTKYAYTEVKIASWDLVHYHSKWMNDSSLPFDRTLRPDIDLIISSHHFNSEKDAINFISEWWKNNANVSFTILKSTLLNPEDCNGLPYCELPISHDEFINDDIDESENKPTKIKYYRSGNISHKEWRINGKFHNENGPAIIQYDSNGNIEYKTWYINDKYHNENGPAVIRYYENGNVECKNWCVNGKYHNENGPAFIAYDENGNITKQQYWENGIKIK